MRVALRKNDGKAQFRKRSLVAFTYKSTRRLEEL